MDGSTVSRAARIKREVTGLALRSSTLKGIAVKQELKDDIGTQSKGLPTLSAVKEEDPAGWSFCLKLGQGWGKSVRVFRQILVTVSLGYFAASLASEHKFLEVLQALPFWIGLVPAQGTHWMPLWRKPPPGPSSACYSGLPRPGLPLGPSGRR